MMQSIPFHHTVEFTTSIPSVVNWWLKDSSGNELAAGSNDVLPDAISTTIEIPATHNELPQGVYSDYRRLYWSYDGNAGRVQYEVRSELPFGVSEDGVRNKLGVPEHNLTDAEIDLVSAYYKLPDLTFVPTTAQSLAIRHAIEATAALELLPTMPLRIAQKESSGTDQYTRGKIDWDAIEDQLRGYIRAGLLVIDPSTAFTGSALFTLSRIPDRFSGVA